MTPREITIEAAGLRLAARRWGQEGGRRVLALHGWLDNAGTWDRMAPILCGARELDLVALDFPGHGRSQHRAPDTWYGFADYVLCVVRVLDALGWETATLLGHSMGGAVATLTAGVAPERVRALLLSEGLTPLTSSDEETCAQLRKGIEAHVKYDEDRRRVHPDMGAIEARIAARPWRLSGPAVSALAARSAEQVEGGWRFTHDVRLKADSLVRFTRGQVVSFLRAVRCPGVLVVAEEGLPYSREEVAAYVAVLGGLHIVRVPGRHHVHLDDPAVVAPHLIELLDQTADPAAGG